MTPKAPDIPPEVPRRGSALSRWIGDVALSLLGWSIEGNIPALRKLVIIVAPHTSAWDFVVGLAAKLSMRLDASYLAKDSLFFWPLSVLLRRTGGLPVDRSGPHNLVEQLAIRFTASDHLLLALAPEGTRQRVEKWKSGFYRIAEAAAVPILPIALDYGRRVIDIGEPLTLTGDAAGDAAKLRGFFRAARGRLDRGEG